MATVLEPTVAAPIEAPTPPDPVLRRPKSTKGFWGWITTVDHKRIGILYGVTAFIFFLFGGVEALLIRLQLAQPNGTFLSADLYNQMFTMHGTTMVFLVVMPISAAFFNYFAPIMIGARDVAFPATQRVQLLDVPVRRHPHQLELPARRRAQRRLVRLRAEHVDHVLTGTQHRLLDLRSAAARHRVDGRCGELHRHDPQPARAGHGAVPHAGVRVDDAGRELPAAVRHADHHGRAVPAHVRPAVRRELLQPRRGR